MKKLDKSKNTDTVTNKSDVEYQDDCCDNKKSERKTECYEDDCEQKEQSSVRKIKKEYQVSGMDCGSCALTIEKSIKKLNSIYDAKVNFSTGKMIVEVTDDYVLYQIPTVVEKLGYKVIDQDNFNNHFNTFEVTGMDCNSCAQTIEKHLSKLSQVQDVSVNFINGTMQIKHTNSIETIQQELKKIGYRGQPIKGSSESDATSKKDRTGQIILLSGVLLLVAYLFMFFNQSILADTLFVLAMVNCGLKPAKSAFYAIKSKSLDMNVLMVSAAIGAGIIGEWSEGALVVFLFAIGNFLQNKAVEKTRKSIKGLMNLTPDTALVKQGHKFIEKGISAVTLGDVLFFQAGERIPLDGIVTKGSSSINQAPITGESIPVIKNINDEVFAGTINQEGSLEIKVIRLTKDSTIARIIHMVEEAQDKKAPSEDFIDKFAKIYMPVVFILALLMMALPPLVFQADFSAWFYRGLELLVVACPCALIISTPVSIVSAIGNAAKNGVLIKGGNFLEKMGSLTAIAVDKTGTVTEGKPKVATVIAYKESNDEILQKIAALEVHTTHPIGIAIQQEAYLQAIRLPEVTNFKNIPGKGITGEISNKTYFAGTIELFVDSIFEPTQSTKIDQLQETGHSIVLLGTDEEILGLVAIADSIRPSSKQALQKLKSMGIQQTIMLTGDNQGAAEKIAIEADLTTVEANLMPEEKVLVIERLQKQGETVAMVGDGINDAPALALADVGIAMGGAGTDTAIETADIVLMADNLEKLPFTIDLSRRTIRIVKQNIVFSLLIKLVALIFIFPGWLALWVAVLSDSGAAVLVTLNALRLTRNRKN